MKTFLMINVMVLPLTLLTACGMMNSRFDCPHQGGVSCKSLDQINRMVDNGELPGRMSVMASGTQNHSNSFETFSKRPVSQEIPLRARESVQRIWITSFEDSEGNYHQDHLIYTVVKESHWVNAPLQPSFKDGQG